MFRPGWCFWEAFEQGQLSLHCCFPLLMWFWVKESRARRSSLEQGGLTVPRVEDQGTGEPQGRDKKVTARVGR